MPRRQKCGNLLQHFGGRIPVRRVEGAAMNKWRLLVGAASVALFTWGASAFVEHGRSVGGAGDAYDGWAFSGLGLSALFVFVVPRSGYVVAVVQLVATGYPLGLCVLASMVALA